MSETIRLKTKRGHIDINIDRFVEAYRSQMRNDELISAFGLTKMRLWELSHRLKLPARTSHLELHGAARASARDVDPTPEEIAERAAIERSRWSPEEESRRAIGRTHGVVSLLSYSSHSSRTRSHVTFREAPYGF